MSSSNLGENIAREWSEEAQAREVWEALQSVKADPPTGLEMLENLAQNDSRLAKMYLGDIYLKGRPGIPSNRDAGEYWLRRSAEEGSIEGAYGLAWHLLNSGRVDAALAEYQRLADLRYSPALFVLGWQYYKGNVVEKDIEKSLAYWELAEKEGHLHASRWICRVLMRDYGGALPWLRGFGKKIALTIPFVRTAASYPSSDRLRT